MVSVPLFGGGTENKTVTFTHNRNRENIKSGEKHSTIFGKIARYFEDLKLVAFTGSYNDLNGKPSSLPASDVSAWAKAASKPSYSWNEIGSKPSAFPPSSHKHAKSDITDFPSSLPASDVQAWAKAANKPSYSWDEIGSKPSSFPPSSHTHGEYVSKNDTGPVELKGTLELTNIADSNSPSHIEFKNNNIAISSYNKIILSSGTNGNSGNASSIALGVTYQGSAKSVLFWADPSKSSEPLRVEPSTNNSWILGSPAAKWKQIYAANSTISTSDREVKKEISYIGDVSREYSSTYMDDAQLISLILGLKACVYKFRDNDSNRPHHGLIAQDVEELLQSLGITDHAAFIKSPKTKDVEVEEEYTDEDGSKKTRKKTVQEEIPGEYIYGLRYEEFIADIIRFCQILYNRNTGLENALKEQKEKAENLEKRIEALENIIKQAA